MWSEADEFMELFRGYLPYYLLIMLPLFIIIAPVCPVGAAHDFQVFRMQQFDLHGVPHGCRSAAVNLEARSAVGWGTSRHCVVARLEDITSDKFREIRSRAGALLIVLPRNLFGLSQEEKQQIWELEEAMLYQEVSIPVYFVEWASTLQTIVNDVASSYMKDDRSTTAVEALVHSIAANGYQIVVSTSQPSPRSDVNIATIQGKLPGFGVEEKLPTVAVVAHYDSFAVAPDLALGTDSNGSGVAMLMELARIFSRLYANPKTHARHNLVFLLTGAGKFNYQGSKKWLEDQLDGVEGSVIQDASFILCLDTVATDNVLYLHVSKPPRDGSPGGNFYKELKSVAESVNLNVTVDTIHKKINLADELLAWEHERYSIRRLPAFTLSSLKSHRSMSRNTILDTHENVNAPLLFHNTDIVAEALARHVYNLSDGKVFEESLEVSRESLDSWLEFLSQPRSAQILLDKQNVLVNSLKNSMSRYLKDVKVSYLVPDKRDPEIVFYDVTKTIVNIYSVKPAVFDLFLTGLIGLYLVAIYFVVQNFPLIYVAVSKFSSSKKSKVQ
ncbi:BOS complex subunit NCLN [Bacillus rossius redtenbacheri]|uniref:BOS complex subunit NCLN n=1 Tax=Bacillus rossius redtenbacheri TaxID=93214 RepID=UPI002FDCF1FC